jgi:hypothetical protein
MAQVYGVVLDEVNEAQAWVFSAAENWNMSVKEAENCFLRLDSAVAVDWTRTKFETAYQVVSEKWNRTKQIADELARITDHSRAHYLGREWLVPGSGSIWPKWVKERIIEAANEEVANTMISIFRDTAEIVEKAYKEVQAINADEVTKEDMEKAGACAWIAVMAQAIVLLKVMCKVASKDISLFAIKTWAIEIFQVVQRDLRVALFRVMRVVAGWSEVQRVSKVLNERLSILWQQDKWLEPIISRFSVLIQQLVLEVCRAVVQVRKFSVCATGEFSRLHLTSGCEEISLDNDFETIRSSRMELHRSKRLHEERFFEDSSQFQELVRVTIANWDRGKKVEPDLYRAIMCMSGSLLNTVEYWAVDGLMAVVELWRFVKGHEAKIQVQEESLSKVMDVVRAWAEIDMMHRIALVDICNEYQYYDSLQGIRGMYNFIAMQVEKTNAAEDDLFLLSRATGKVFCNFQSKGKLENWRQSDGEYVISWDPAMTNDSSVMMCMEKSRKHIVDYVVANPNAEEYDVQAENYLKVMVEKYKASYVIIDDTGLGKWALSEAKKKLDRSVQVKGYTFGNASKPRLITNLKRMIEKQEISFPNIEQLIDQLGKYSYKITENGFIEYHHPETGHDDFVIALALAAWAVSEVSR